MRQTFTSANTSINSAKLPAIYHKIDFRYLDIMEHGLMVLDYGCGKFTNGMDYIKDEYGGYFGYDKYNLPDDVNTHAMRAFHNGEITCILCSNVLNVIDSDDVLLEITSNFVWSGLPYFVTVYEGDKSGKGKSTKADCYQRNEHIQNYMKYFPGAVIKHGVITNAPEYVK